MKVPDPPKIDTGIFIERIPEYVIPRKYHGHAYYDVMTRRCVTVIYPFHYVVQLLWRINLKWSRHTQKDSWIERQVAALEKERRCCKGPPLP